MTIPLLFIHLSVERHLGCFRFRATMDNGAMNVHIQEFLWTSTLLGEFLGVELLGQQITPYPTI